MFSLFYFGRRPLLAHLTSVFYIVHCFSLFFFDGKKIILHTVYCLLFLLFYFLFLSLTVFHM